MATTPLPPDFSEFLRLLGEHEVKYLLVGGHAVGYHGYPRTTGDMDVWVPREKANAERLVAALRNFGFETPELRVELFLEEGQVIRMGVPPLRIEVQTSVSGVDFDDCFADRIVAQWNDVEVNIISLEKLRENKRAAGRLKDLSDLEHLE
jgi:hypothetical protein